VLKKLDPTYGGSSRTTAVYQRITTEA